MRYLYGYDGSGVPMTCEVDFLGRVKGTERSMVRFSGFNPPLDPMTEIDWSEDDDGTTRLVRTKDLFPDGERPELASFNFLD